MSSVTGSGSFHVGLVRAGVSQAIQDAGYAPDSSELIMNPNTTLELSADEAASVMSLVENLEELDDVSGVYHNLELTDELMAELA